METNHITTFSAAAKPSGANRQSTDPSLIELEIAPEVWRPAEVVGLVGEAAEAAVVLVVKVSTDRVIEATTSLLVTGAFTVVEAVAVLDSAV